MMSRTGGIGCHHERYPLCGEWLVQSFQKRSKGRRVSLTKCAVNCAALCRARTPARAEFVPLIALENFGLGVSEHNGRGSGRTVLEPFDVGDHVRACPVWQDNSREFSGQITSSDF
jgi:hypothetical protein